MSVPDRNLALELVRVTEAAAMAAARWMGKGDRDSADRAAVEAMRFVLNSIPMDGIIVIGEGEKDEAPMLYNGERIGNGTPPEVDIAVDPIDGTRLLSLGRPNSLSVIALSERGTMFNPRDIFYMDKIAVGPEAKGMIDIEAPVEHNIKMVAKAKGKSVEDVTVVILDRPRHEKLIAEVRAVGARIKLITDGDVSGALVTCKEDSGIDMLLGIGGSPEGVIAACALKCLGGDMQCKLWCKDEREREKVRDYGMDPDRVLTIDDLVRGDNVFFAATGITDGDLLDGVRYEGRRIRTSSMVMRSKSGTVRFVEAYHQPAKLAQISQVIRY